MIFLSLFYTFFLIGVFGFGGGYGMLSLIQHEVVVNHHWMSSAEFTNIVAISQMTPGPISINTATYCGYTAVMHLYDNMLLGVVGSLLASLALILPSFLLMLFISKMFMKHMNAPVVQSVFNGLRPAVVGLMLAATLLLMNSDNFFSPTEQPWHFYISCLIFILTFVGVKVMKINPIRMIVYAAFAGLLLLY